MTKAGPDSKALAQLRIAARDAAAHAYAPYSHMAVGAALLFADGQVITGANVENASYGLSLCAETVATSKAFADGRRGGLVAVAVFGGKIAGADAIVPSPEPITPCGRCRQVLNELAQTGGTDPLILCMGEQQDLTMNLSALLPHAFGPANLAPTEITY